MNEEIQLNRLMADAGSLLITGTAAVTGKFFGFVVNEDAVITHVYVTPEGGTPATHTERTDLASAALTTGIYYSAGYINGKKAYIDSIQLTSGSVVAYYI
jgi:hypothetical protein